MALVGSADSAGCADRRGWLRPHLAQRLAGAGVVSDFGQERISVCGKMIMGARQRDKVRWGVEHAEVDDLAQIGNGNVLWPPLLCG